MLTNWIIVAAAFGYLSLLFAVAYWGDKRADAGRRCPSMTCPGS